MRARLAIAACALSVLAASPASGYENGRLPDSALSPIASGQSCNRLANSAAAPYNTAALSVGHPLPTNGCLSAYRDFAGQTSLRIYWCGLGQCANAAVPGTSNHGLGIATDLPAESRAVFDRSGGLFAFDKACSDAPWEIWHYTACRAFHRPDPGINLASPILRRGSGGPGQAAFVRELQHKLRRHGDKDLNPDGDFGKRTAHAVKLFQRSHGLKVDAVVGPNTWSKLRGPVTIDPEPPKPAPAPVGPVTGVDVSVHQGDVNWDAVRRAGIEFAIVKATEGEDYIDPRFNQARLEAIHQNGIIAGAYVYLRPRAGRPGSVEGTFLVNTLQAAGYGVGELRPVIDIEETALSSSATCAYLKQTVDTIRKQMDVKPIIYTFQSFASATLRACGGWMTDLPLWIAAPGNPDPSTAPWHSFTIRQTSFTGRVPGISGDVDTDIIPGGREVLNDLRISEPQAQGHNGAGHRNRKPCRKHKHPRRCHERRHG